VNEEQQAEKNWERICTSQGWNEYSQVVHLEAFIRDQKLFAKFVKYAGKAADEENRRVW